MPWHRKAKKDAADCEKPRAGEIKYQIGEGSEIDQLLAQWHANIIGIGDIFDPDQRKTALQNLFKNNFVTSMRELYNPFRLYSVNDDAGAIICTFPDGAKKPAIPIPYCQETMHGFEYALAGLMISEGMIEEGLTIVRSIRDRYDGERRNPWNEIECGSNYARSMASFAMIPIFSGFKFDMVKKKIGFAPIVNQDNFRCIWSLDSGWGRVELNAEGASLTVLAGSLTVREIAIDFPAESVEIDGKSVPFTVENGAILLHEAVTASAEIVIR